MTRRKSGFQEKLRVLKSKSVTSPLFGSFHIFFPSGCYQWYTTWAASDFLFTEHEHRQQCIPILFKPHGYPNAMVKYVASLYLYSSSPLDNFIHSNPSVGKTNNIQKKWPEGMQKKCEKCCKWKVWKVFWALSQRPIPHCGTCLTRTLKWKCARKQDWI